MIRAWTRTVGDYMQPEAAAKHALMIKFLNGTLVEAPPPSVKSNLPEKTRPQVLRQDHNRKEYKSLETSPRNR